MDAREPAASLARRSPLDRLLARLELDAGGAGDRGTWIGHAGSRSVSIQNRIFGGLVIAQTIMAAGRTVDDRQVHSVQQVFLRPGQAHIPLHYEVEPLFVGRSFAWARVTVSQGGDMISHAQIGLSSTDGGLTHSTAMPPTKPRDAMENRDRLRGHKDWNDQPFVSLVDANQYHSDDPALDTWVQAAGSVPDDPLIHRALMGYISDRTMLSTARKPHESETVAVNSATLNHSIWFHDEIDCSQWHSYRLDSPKVANSRGMVRGEFWSEDGHLVASTAQEGTIRARR